MAESLLVGCNFVSCICKLKPKKRKNLKKNTLNLNLILKKLLDFYPPWRKSRDGRVTVTS